MSRFDYILRKIISSPVINEPFRHIYIEDFFSFEDFNEITRDPAIRFPTISHDKSLIAKLRESGYEPILFPGCTTNEQHYLKWHRNKGGGYDNLDTCEGFGIAYRLKQGQNALIKDLVDFFGSEPFFAAMAERFGVDIDQTTMDSGLQKYLDGYEISPHPDIRKKALTYMVNINPGDSTEDLNIHTHYLKFNKNKEYIYTYWQNNPSMDRCWVPWDWCETIKVQNRNNSIVVFSPGDDTLHAVRAKYNHLELQRTQLYGNLWYKSVEIKGKPSWSDLDIRPSREKRTMSATSRKMSNLKSRLLSKFTLQ